MVSSWQRGEAATLPDERDAALRERASAQVRELDEADGLVEDEALAALAQGILAAAVPPLDERAPALRMRIVRSAGLEAAALPDGQLLVSAGLLAALRSEAELAALLAHEAAHVVARHRLSSTLYDEKTASTVERQTLSRRQEADADRRALEWMIRAGYDPRAMLRLLDELASEPDPAPHLRVRAWESHPDVGRRRRAAARQIRGAELGEARVGARSYARAVAELRLLAAELWLASGELDRARDALDRHGETNTHSGRAHFLRAEIVRRESPDGRQTARVRELYERAVALEPRDPRALRALGLVLREAGEWERARELLGRYLEADPEAVDRVLIERYLE